MGGGGECWNPFPTVSSGYQHSIANMNSISGNENVRIIPYLWNKTVKMPKTKELLPPGHDEDW